MHVAKCYQCSIPKDQEVIKTSKNESEKFLTPVKGIIKQLNRKKWGRVLVSDKENNN